VKGRKRSGNHSTPEVTNHRKHIWANARPSVTRVDDATATSTQPRRSRQRFTPSPDLSAAAAAAQRKPLPDSISEPLVCNHHHGITLESSVSAELLLSGAISNSLAHHF